MDDRQIFPLKSSSTKIQCLISPNELPLELIINVILVKLTTKTLVGFKCVSKQWKSIISNPQFSKSHLHFLRSSNIPQQSLLIIQRCNFKVSFFTFDFSRYDNDEIAPFSETNSDSQLHKNPRSQKGLVEIPEQTELCGVAGADSVGILCSCDGLVCIDLGLDYVCIWNPITQELRKIANPPSFITRFTMWGFGYVSSIDDYKILTVSYTVDYPMNAHTLGLNDGRWTEKDVIDGYYIGSDCPGTLFKERLFWVLYTELNSGIVGFDLGSGNCEKAHIPEWMREFNLSVCTIGTCLSVSYKTKEGILETYILKHYGDWSSWTKLYSFESDLLLNQTVLLRFTMAGKCLLLNYTRSDEGSIILVDAKQNPPNCTEVLKWICMKHCRILRVSYLPLDEHKDMG